MYGFSSDLSASHLVIVAVQISLLEVSITALNSSRAVACRSRSTMAIFSLPQSKYPLLQLVLVYSIKINTYLDQQAF